MSQPMSYAEALNEARQVIVQQQYRIKADAEKIKSQQQTILDQSATLVESERKIREQAGEGQRLAGELQGVTQRLAEMTTAREHAEAVVDRQGQRLTSLQASAADMEKTIAEQGLPDRRPDGRARRPAAPTAHPRGRGGPGHHVRPAEQGPPAMKRPTLPGSPLRLAEVISEADDQPQAQAA